MRASGCKRRHLLFGAAAIAVTGGGAPGCRTLEPAMPAGSEPDATLAELLAVNRARDPEFGGGLSNHQSMALVALVEMGAGVQQLRAFAKRYDRNLERLRPRGPSVAYTDIDRVLGQPEAFVGLVDAFAAELRSRGRDAVLRATLPKLWPSVGTVAFHGVIRTAYAVRRDEDPLELAHALAYWASRAVALRPLPTRTGTERDAAAIVRTALARSELLVEKGGLIDARMREAAAKPGFDDVVASFAISDDALADIAAAALRLYLGTGDFTALHGVTGTHAVRVLLPWTSDPAVAAHWHWQWLVSAALTIRGAKLREPDDTGAPPWSALLAEALRRHDDHDVKLVDTCSQESAALAAPGYRAAAALRLGPSRAP
jgi:hypothetical protein